MIVPRGRGWFLAFALSATLGPLDGWSQEVPDSVQQIPDSTQALPDSLAPPPDSAALALADSLRADSLARPPILPSLPNPVQASAVSERWDWEREDLIALRGQTLLELLTLVPGVLPVRGGDYGSPHGAIPTGAGGGALRIFWDGVEHLPVEGSIPDLNRIPLVGLEAVRVRRSLSGIEVHLERLVQTEAQPYSFIQAGTGDLDTNILRGAFISGRALGGKAGIGIERIDTRGRSGDNPGAVTGGWFRYSLHRENQGGVEFELRRMSSDRSDTLSLPTSVKRSDWTLRGRWLLTEGLLLDGWATGASLEPKDSVAVLPFAEPDRKQQGLALTAHRGALWGRVTARLNSGVGIAERELAAHVQAASERWGGVSAEMWNEGWDGQSGSGLGFRGWITPVSGVSIFGARRSGKRSVPYLGPAPLDSLSSPGDSATFAEGRTDPRFSDRSESRLGAQVAWRGLRLLGARVEVEGDSVFPIGLPFDRRGVAVALRKRTGWEIDGRLPLLKGWGLQGGFQLWDQPEDSIRTPYFPDHTYTASLSFHDTFLPTENFELWVDLGAQGRSGMAVPRLAPDEEGVGQEDPETAVPLALQSVPFYQSWFLRVQMRIVSVNIFIGFDNLSLRDRNQDIPSMLLPGTRGVYGVRWTMWN